MKHKITANLKKTTRLKTIIFVCVCACPFYPPPATFPFVIFVILCFSCVFVFFIRLWRFFSLPFLFAAGAVSLKNKNSKNKQRFFSLAVFIRRRRILFGACFILCSLFCFAFVLVVCIRRWHILLLPFL